MRPHTALLALIGTLAFTGSALAQSAYFKVRDREEKIELNDPFDANAVKSPDKAKAVWHDRGITYTTGERVEVTRRMSEVVRFQWKDEPTLLVEARASIAAGQFAKALSSIEIVLRKFDPVKKVPGNLWLKAAELKLDALSGLSSESQLSSFISLLEQNDDGSVPGLAAKIKLAKVTQLVRAGDFAGVITESDKLMLEFPDPEAQARLHLFKADAQYGLRRYEDALKTYLRVPVFYGAEKAFIPQAFLGAAKSFRSLDGPATRGQQLQVAASFYLRQVIREYPLSKEATEARELLTPEERAAEEKLQSAQTPDTAPADAKPETEAPKPDESKSAEATA